MSFICFKNKHVLPGVARVPFLHLRYEDQWYYLNGGLIHRLCPLIGLQYVYNTIKIILEVLENENVFLFSFSMFIKYIQKTTVYAGKISFPFNFSPILLNRQRANWRLVDNQNIKLLCWLARISILQLCRGEFKKRRNKLQIKKGRKYSWIQ